jgi:hypothetical protein
MNIPDSRLSESYVYITPYYEGVAQGTLPLPPSLFLVTWSSVSLSPLSLECLLRFKALDAAGLCSPSFAFARIPSRSIDKMRRSFFITLAAPLSLNHFAPPQSVMAVASDRLPLPLARKGSQQEIRA